MANQPEATLQPAEPCLLSHAEIDELLLAAKAALAAGTFDATDCLRLQQLVEGLGDDRGAVRLSVAQTLGQIGAPATPLLLEALVQHSNPVVRRAAGKTLTLIADPRAVPTLIQALLQDKDTVVKGSAVGALARMGSAAVPPLLEILAAPEQPESDKGHAAWALSFIGAAAVDYLYPALASDSLDVRCAAIGAIASVVQEKGDSQAFEVLLTTLTDAEPLLRAEAASALGKLNSWVSRAVGPLTQCLQDADLDVRKTAALSLMKLGHPDAIAPLQAALAQETEAAVQRVFQLALTQLARAMPDDDWD